MGQLTLERDTMLEMIEHDGKLLAHIVRARVMPERTEFITGDDEKQQVGFIVYPKGGEIVRHVHRAMERHLVGTSEVILVRQGLCEVDFYTDQKEFIETRILRQGDIVVLLGGGHGFRCLEDTVLLEIKQGPYIGPEEKERF